MALGHPSRRLCGSAHPPENDTCGLAWRPQASKWFSWVRVGWMRRLARLELASTGLTAHRRARSLKSHFLAQIWEGVNGVFTPHFNPVITPWGPDTM